MLKVININSKIDLTPHDCAFIEQVIHYAEKDTRWKAPNHLSNLLDEVPVYLICSEDMPDLPDHIKEKIAEENQGNSDYYVNGISDENPEESEANKNRIRKTKPPIEYLGFYTIYPKNYINGFAKEDNENIPSVFLCPENIRLICKPKTLEDYQRILADVTIHEFAHAKMDDGKEFGYMDKEREFFDSIEEPFANWFVLNYFHFYGNGSLFNIVKASMAQQPAFYKLGVNFYNSNIASNRWVKWKAKKEELVLTQLKQKQNDWLDSAKGAIIKGSNINLDGKLTKVLGLTLKNRLQWH